MAGPIVIDQRDLVEVQLMISRIKYGSTLAIQRATNDSLTSVRTEAVNLIYGKVTLKKTTIRKHFKINKMTTSNLSADVACVGDPVPLIEYSARSVVKGVSVSLLRSGGRDIVRHAFIATMKSGHRGVFWREPRQKGKGVWKVGKRRKLPSPGTRHPAAGKEGLEALQLPIHELYGPRVPDIFDDADIMQPVLLRSRIKFQERLEHHTNYLMRSAA